jgi:uncharacterized protein (TIGR03086 family)
MTTTNDIGAALMAGAAAPLVTIARGVKPDQLDAPTPCTEFTVRRLVNHLLYWGPSLEAAGHKTFVPPPAAGERETDLATADWADRLTEHADKLVAAWRDPAAWEGVAAMGGPNELPAAMIGGMVVVDLVVHGWDLAVATGQRGEWDADVLAFTWREVAKTAQQGRDMGVYGPEVGIPDTATPLDRILGMTGRDPTWSPAA